MRALLMHRDRDFDAQRALPWNDEALARDLELDTMLEAMAGEDSFVLNVSRKALLLGPGNDPETIRYRQEVLKDCLRNSALVVEIYVLVVRASESARKEWWGMSSSIPTSLLYSSASVLEMLMSDLRALRLLAEEHGGRFESEGFSTLFATIRRELGEDYLGAIRAHLTRVRFRKGMLLSAELGKGNEGGHYMLRETQGDASWLERILGKGPPSHTFYIAERDQAGGEILADMQHRGISRVAVALAESAEHVLSFFKALRTELGFYVGCLNLHARLASKEEPVCFPVPCAARERKLNARGLYDVCLSLHTGGRVVGNSVDADERSLIVVTGANQGGKSTFLRSVGLAQLMMQAGMFVGAESLTAGVSPALCTHFKREEDATMKSGKFDEELSRMSEIVDHLTPDAMVLFNESFASTTEREGSEIAVQIVSALLEKNVRVFYVTHLYQFARGFAERRDVAALFLRAERKSDGTRTFRLVEGEPLETSFGADLFRAVFTDTPNAPAPMEESVPRTSISGSRG